MEESSIEDALKCLIRKDAVALMKSTDKWTEEHRSALMKWCMGVLSRSVGYSWTSAEWDSAQNVASAVLSELNSFPAASARLACRSALFSVLGD